MQTETQMLDLSHLSRKGLMLTMGGLRMMQDEMHRLGYTGRAVCVRASVVTPFLEGALSRLWPERTAHLLLTFHATHAKRGTSYVTMALPMTSWTYALKD